MIHRLRYLIIALGLVFGSTGLASGVAAASGDQVKAVWDATADANCQFSIHGGPLQPCPGGSVISERMMSRDEAVAAGYDFVTPVADARANVAALDKLRQIVRERARARGAQKAHKFADVMTAFGCSPTYAYLQYTASNTANRPTIGVDINYQYINGCNTIQVTYSNTYFVGAADGNTWYDHTKFGTGSDDPACYYDLPHGATTLMGGAIGETFESAVEHGCGWNVPRDYGSLSLY